MSLIFYCEFSIYQRISQKTIASRKISSDFQCGVWGKIKFYLFPKKFASFPTFFQVELKTHIVSFLANCSTNSRIFCGLWSRYTSSIKAYFASQINLHFQVINVSPGRNRKKTSNISDTINQFSSVFHQNDRTVSGHLILVTVDPENVGKCQNLQKF